MHELSLAAGILDIVQQYVPIAQADCVRAVRVRVGEIAGVMPDSLHFCFGAIVAGTPYASASLDIERVPARGMCGGCGRAIDLSTLRFICPVCGSLVISVDSGEELRVVDVELVDPLEVPA